MLWACIVLPHLALDTLQRRRPPGEQPLVLIDGPLQARHVLDADAVQYDRMVVGDDDARWHGGLLG